MYINIYHTLKKKLLMSIQGEKWMLEMQNCINNRKKSTHTYRYPPIKYINQGKCFTLLWRLHMCVCVLQVFYTIWPKELFSIYLFIYIPGKAHMETGTMPTIRRHRGHKKKEHPRSVAFEVQGKRAKAKKCKAKNHTISQKIAKQGQPPSFLWVGNE